MKIAMLTLAALVALAGMTFAAATQAVPENKVVVVRVTNVNGLAKFSGQTSETRSSVFNFDGMEYEIDGSALKSLDGVETVLLIDKRTDSVQGGNLVRKHEQEVRAFNTESFEVNDIPGRVLAYQVAMIGGNLRLVGDGDQIVARGGANGPYQVWKVTDVDMVSRDAIVIR